MSAWLCSDHHIYILAAWAHANGLTDDPVACAVGLRAVNNEALRQRYGDAPQRLTCGPALGLQRAREHLKRVSPQWVNSQARCLAYQCAEGDADEVHPSAPMLCRIVAAADKAASGGREDGAWGVDYEVESQQTPNTHRAKAGER